MSGPYGEYDYYAVLGVEPGASDEQIRQAYRELAFVLHPDRVPPKYERARLRAEAHLKRVNDAYEALSDPAKRSRYDRGWVPGPGSTPPGPDVDDSRAAPRARGSKRQVDGGNVTEKLGRFGLWLARTLGAVLIVLIVVGAIVSLVLAFAGLLFLLFVVIVLGAVTKAILGG